MSRVVIGIFVGGAGRRMGGVAKGLLPAPASAETLIARLCRVCRSALPGVTPYLVGDAEAYAPLGLPQLSDDPAGSGPIGGLRSLLDFAVQSRAEQALALACDLPFIDERVLAVLSAPLAGPARVPFVGERFQPLAASYAPGPSLAAVDRVLLRGQRALMQVLAEIGPALERVESDAISEQALRDWDTPSDVTR